MKPFFLMIALSVAAAPALANDCPTAADLAKGITFRTTEGLTEYHRAGTTPNMTTIQVTSPDGDGSLISIREGIYSLSVIPIKQGQLDPENMDIWSGPEAASWPAPKPSATWTTTGLGGATVTSGPEAQITFGKCSYPFYEVVFDYTDEENYVETYSYLPTLGTSLLTRTKDASSIDNILYTDIGKMQ